MASNLNSEFEEGRLARIAGKAATDCPYYATSDCADAWHAGYSWEGPKGLAHYMTAEKVTHGRGYRINVAGRNCTKEGRPKCKAFFLIDYQDKGAPIVSRSAMLHPGA